MHDLPPPAAYVAIDPVAWTQAKQIRWPSGEATVAVFDGSSGSDHEFLRVAHDRHEFRFSQRGDRLTVVMGLEAGLGGGQAGWNFLAAHETFHIAAQMYGAKIPFAYIDLDSRLLRQYASGADFAEFYRAIDTMHEGVRVPTADVGCGPVAKAYKRLDDIARTYFNYKAFWEWPAEFYAYSVAFHGGMDAYENFRGRLFTNDTGYRLFVSGVKVAELLEAKMGRDVWQARAVSGQSMLASFFEAYDCGVELDERPVLTIQRMDYGQDSGTGVSTP